MSRRRCRRGRRRAIGNYAVKRVLGAGATGIVYLAKDRALQRKVAIKVLSAGLGFFSAADRQRLAQRFKREARTVAKLCHAAIVPIYEADLDGDEPFFVMEYLAGGSLDDRLRTALEHVRRAAPGTLRRSWPRWSAPSVMRMPAASCTAI